MNGCMRDTFEALAFYMESAANKVKTENKGAISVSIDFDIVAVEEIVKILRQAAEHDGDKVLNGDK